MKYDNWTLSIKSLHKSMTSSCTSVKLTYCISPVEVCKCCWGLPSPGYSEEGIFQQQQSHLQPQTLAESCFELHTHLLLDGAEIGLGGKREVKSSWSGMKSSFSNFLNTSKWWRGEGNLNTDVLLHLINDVVCFKFRDLPNLLCWIDEKYF